MTIQYEYDYGRLVGISYPDHPENNVKYHYGGINSSYNRIGRLMLREDGITIDYKAKYVKQQQSIKDSYKDFGVAYNGEDNDNYVNGEGFCCNDKSLEAAQERAKAARNAKTRAVDKIAYLLHALTTGIETNALIRKALGKNGLTLLDSR